MIGGRSGYGGLARTRAKTITGYISGNLLISIVCGLLTYAVLDQLGGDAVVIRAGGRRSRATCADTARLSSVIR